MKNEVNKSFILLGLFSLFIILLLLFKINNDNNRVTTNIDKLKEVNDSLLNSNNVLQTKIQMNNDTIKEYKVRDEKVKLIILDYENKIKEIRNEKIKIKSVYTNLPPDSVIRLIAEYIRK